jgi:hypothetical protein
MMVARRIEVDVGARCTLGSATLEHHRPDFKTFATPDPSHARSTQRGTAIMSGKRANIFGQGRPEKPYEERDEDAVDVPQRATAAQLAARKYVLPSPSLCVPRYHFDAPPPQRTFLPRAC